jgi:hypothetical protein
VSTWPLWILGGMMVAVLLGSAAIAGQSPAFWWGMGRLAWSHLLPSIKAQIARDMADPEVDRRTKEAARNPGGAVPKGTGVTTGKVIKQPAATKRPSQRSP